MVGSMPSLTRSGRPAASCSSSIPAGSTSTALRVRSAMAAMLDCRTLLAGERSKPRLKKLRILFVLLGLGVLGLVSMVFGMMAAVSQDLPAIYNFAQYKASKNSEVYDASGEPIGTLTSDQNKILLTSGQISPNIKNAVVSIEDSRFYEHNGVDFRGIARALIKDVLSQSAAAGRLDDHRAVRQERPRSAKAAARSSRSSARRRWPTGSSATGPRTKSSPSTSTRSTSARAPTGSRRRREPTSARRIPAAAPRPSPAPRCSSPGRRRRWRRSSHRLRPTTPRSIPKTRWCAATSCSKRCTNRAT